MSEQLTAHEARCIRIALAFGDPAVVDLADDDLERAKAKLLAIEKRGASPAEHSQEGERRES